MIYKQALNNQALLETLASMRDIFEQGINEYELLKMLQKPPFNAMPEAALDDSLVLFQTHFILFHCLYRLRNRWRDEKIGELEIFTTNIKLSPMCVRGSSSFVDEVTNKTDNQHPSRDNDLGFSDPLAAYYLNLSHLNETDKQEVDDLLDSFWVKMVTTAPLMSNDQLQFHLNILKIEDSQALTLDVLKRQYRKLQHDYHPDKGGSLEKTQTLVKSFEVLKVHLKNNVGAD